MKVKSITFLKGGGMSFEFSVYPDPWDPTIGRALGWLPLHLFPVAPNFTLAISIFALVINLMGVLSVFIIWMKDIQVLLFPSEPFYC
jgi:hypothetical protein